MSKQTAVKWLWNNLTDDMIGELSPEQIKSIYQLIEQAKEMEKEQIINFTENYVFKEWNKYPLKTIEQHYLDCFDFKVTNKEKEHLLWLYNRIINVYGENENVDFLIKFKEIIETNF
jgi:plasmid replication initiation protein